jgi:DNA-binding CsgD family transcriptional regulator
VSAELGYAVLSGHTPSDAETHLTRVFQKLALRSRTQVAAEIARTD